MCDTDATIEAFADPRAGDRFHEFYSFWLYVVHVVGNWVCTMEGVPPCTLPDDGKVQWQTKQAFREKYAYKSIPGYSIRLHSRGNDVRGWLKVGEPDGD